MKIYLMRHGDYSIKNPSHTDLLTEKGKADIQVICELLKSNPIEVDVILHSSRARSKETAEILSTCFHAKHGVRQSAGLEPLDEVSFIATELNVIEKDILIVGHLPYLNKLVSKLLINNEDKEIVDFQTGTLICLEKLGPGRFIIHWILDKALFGRS